MAGCHHHRTGYDTPLPSRPVNHEAWRVTKRAVGRCVTDVVVCWLVALHPSIRPLYLRDRSAQTIVPAAMLKRSFRSNFLSHPQYTDTGWVATGVPIFSHWYDSNLNFCFSFPSYISGVHHFWVRFLRMWPFFNPTIKVVTFRLRGWCLLGVFLLPAFTCRGHERQDLLSPCKEMHVCTD